MMPRAILVAAALFASACSVPDDGSMDRLTGSIGRLGPTASFEARRAEARARAISDLENMNQSDVLGDAVCRDMIGGVNHPILVHEALACLMGNKNYTMQQCIDVLVDGIRDRYIGQGTLSDITRCGYSWRGKIAVNPKWDMSEITDDDLARSALSSEDGPPDWMIAAGIIGVGATGALIILAPEFLPLLCVLATNDHWSCPGSPGYPPGETPQPDGGGDR